MASKSFQLASMANLVGSLATMPKSTIPDGFLECDGALISRTTYSDLFDFIGTDYGVGDGSTTFALPDLRAEFLRGWANTSANDPDAATRTDRGDGTTGDNVGTKQGHELNSHNHTYSVASVDNTADSIADGSSNVETAARPTSFNGGNETRPRNVNVMYCIKY